MRIDEKNKVLLLLIFIFFNGFQIFGQQKNTDKMQKLTLNDVLAIAVSNSLDAVRVKQQYGASYWLFESYKSSVLPQISLELQPISYNNSVVKRYDYNNNIDVYKKQQTFNSYANISLNQIISATGATVFLNSSFNRLTSTGDISSKDYSVTPVSFGFFQPIMGFNKFKWEYKITPLQLEQSKKEYPHKIQEINLKAVTFFFNWALASKKVEMARENSETSKKLFAIGKKRYDLGSIERDDILNLELDVYNAETYLLQSEKELEKSSSEMKLFLRDDKCLSAEPDLPELISNMQIDVLEAVQFAEQNNPDIFSLRIKKLSALRDLDQVIKENRFDLSIGANYGLNQYANTVQDAYSNLQKQEIVTVQFKMPILDWGERKASIKTARLNKEVADIEIQKEEDNLHQEIILKVSNFNMQNQIVSGASRSNEISKSSYEITEKRFLSGSTDLLKLTSSRKAWQLASENYIMSLLNYWKFYYEVQQITLYDFLHKSNLINVDK